MLCAVTPPVLGPPVGGASSMPAQSDAAFWSLIVLTVLLLSVVFGFALLFRKLLMVRERRSLDPKLREEFFAQVQSDLRDPILVNQARRQVRAARREEDLPGGR
jgi:hypothetical protein